MRISVYNPEAATNTSPNGIQVELSAVNLCGSEAQRKQSKPHGEFVNRTNSPKRKHTRVLGLRLKHQDQTKDKYMNEQLHYLKSAPTEAPELKYVLTSGMADRLSALYQSQTNYNISRTAAAGRTSTREEVCNFTIDHPDKEKMMKLCRLLYMIDTMPSRFCGRERSPWQNRAIVNNIGPGRGRKDPHPG